MALHNITRWYQCKWWLKALRTHPPVAFTVVSRYSTNISSRLEICTATEHDICIRGIGVEEGRRGKQLSAICVPLCHANRENIFLVCEKKPLRTVSHVPCLRVNCSVSGVSLYLNEWVVRVLCKVFQRCAPWFITHHIDHQEIASYRSDPFNSATKSYLAGESRVIYPGSPSWLQRGYLLLSFAPIPCMLKHHVCFFWKELSLINDKD